MRRYIYILFFTALSTLSVGAQGHIRSLDSLLHHLPSTREYYIPQPISDSLLLSSEEDWHIGRQELLQYYSSVRPLTPPRGLATRLGLPLVLSYDQASDRAFPLNFSDVSLVFPQPSYGFYLPDLGGSLPERLLLEVRIERNLMQWLGQNHPDLFVHKRSTLMAGYEELSISNVSQPIESYIPQGIEREQVKQLAEGLQRQEIVRRYWQPSFEGTLQFSQNYISDNWHKGGTSNLNLYMRSYFGLLYTKNKVRWNTELENKLSLYNSDRKYRISEDLLRLRSNFGLKASKRWSWTVDAEMRTQLFYIRNADGKVIQSAPFAPLVTNEGIGMQYNYSKRYARVYGRKLSFSMNIAPLSHTWRYSHRGDIDLKRHGLRTDKRSLHQFGSTFRAELKTDFNLDISWTSRLYVNTNYDRLEAEWENTLNMRISRYLSTRINVHLRYDDNVASSSSFGKYLQVNELLSFGFNYKL